MVSGQRVAVDDGGCFAISFFLKGEKTGKRGWGIYVSLGELV